MPHPFAAMTPRLGIMAGHKQGIVGIMSKVACHKLGTVCGVGLALHALAGIAAQVFHGWISWVSTCVSNQTECLSCGLGHLGDYISGRQYYNALS